jgi:hypothetical protein
MIVRGTFSVNRSKLLFALGAFALLANACNPSGQGRSSTTPSTEGQSPTQFQPREPGTALTTAGTTAGLSLQVDIFPYALTGDTFPVIVSFRNTAGQLMNVVDNITIKLSTNPTAATMLGSSIKAPVAGVARFDVSLSKVGQGYVITASSTKAGTSTSAPFNVTYSQDAGTPATVLSAAQVISPKVPMFASMSPGDVHYYKFSATTGQQVSISSYANRIDNADWDTSLRLRLIAPDGVTEIARSGAANADAPGIDNGLLLVSIPQDGDYTIACDVDQSGFEGGTYALVMTLLAAPTAASLPKETEAWGTTGQNDTIATAQKLGLGTLYGHYDSTATGAPTSDFYAITILNPVRVRVDLNAARSGAAYGDRTWVGRLELQDAAGNVLWGNDRSYGSDPAIDYVITKAGTYYVRVTASDYQPNASTSPYFLTYSTTPYNAATEATTNTSTAAAMTLAYNSDVSGSFTAAGTHWFAFGGTAGDLVRLIVQDRTVLQSATLAIQPPGATPVAAAPTASVTVFQADGVTEVPTGYSFTDATKSRLNYRQTILPSTNTYLIRVQSTAAGKFGLRLERVALSSREVEPNHTATTATLMPATGWISGTIASAGEQDHFKVHGEAGQLLTVSLLAAAGSGLGSPLSDWGSSLLPTVEVRDAAGNLLSTTSADRKGSSNFAENIQHPVIASIANAPPTVQTSFRAPAAADYDITVSDADGQGGASYFYALTAGKNQ